MTSESAWAKCCWCDRRWPVAELRTIEDPSSRIESEEEIPMGDCPACGHMCYLYVDSVNRCQLFLAAQELLDACMAAEAWNSAVIEEQEQKGLKDPTREKLLVKLRTAIGRAKGGPLPDRRDENNGRSNGEA